jgi:integrase
MRRGELAGLRWVDIDFLKRYKVSQGKLSRPIVTVGCVQSQKHRFRNRANRGLSTKAFANCKKKSLWPSESTAMRAASRMRLSVLAK